MADFLTDVGEEWLAENDVSGATLTLTVFDQSTDSLTELDNLSAITTEPGGAGFSRLTDTVSTLVINGDFGVDNDSTITFDVSDSTVSVDHGALIVNFQSDTVAGDGSATDNLVAVASLPQTYDLSNLDELEVAAGDLELTVS